MKSRSWAFVSNFKELLEESERGIKILCIDLDTIVESFHDLIPASRTVLKDPSTILVFFATGETLTRKEIKEIGNAGGLYFEKRPDATEDDLVDIIRHIFKIESPPSSAEMVRGEEMPITSSINSAKNLSESNRIESKSGQSDDEPAFESEPAQQVYLESDTAEVSSEESLVGRSEYEETADPEPPYESESVLSLIEASPSEESSQNVQAVEQEDFLEEDRDQADAAYPAQAPSDAHQSLAEASPNQFTSDETQEELQAYLESDAAESVDYHAEAYSERSSFESSTDLSGYGAEEQEHFLENRDQSYPSPAPIKDTRSSLSDRMSMLIFERIDKLSREIEKLNKNFVSVMQEDRSRLQRQFYARHTPSMPKDTIYKLIKEANEPDLDD